MAVKRTRTSNQIDLAPSAAAAKSAQNQTAAQLPSRIVTPSPVKETADTTNVSNLGDFLKRCQYCKNRIQEGVEVFMYKDFCAYCSVGCRDIQISLDRLAERQAACSTERVIQYQEMKDVRSHCSS